VTAVHLDTCLWRHVSNWTRVYSNGYCRQASKCLYFCSARRWYVYAFDHYMSQFAYIHLTDWDTCYEILVDAIAKIKSTYGITINWQGDPCAPEAYSWEGLNCSGDGDSRTTPPRITSL
jgi:hypothetical protein